MLLLLPGLTACGSTPEPVSVVPAADLVRPACRPPAHLMVRPRLPKVAAGEAMAERAARDGASLSALARDFADLQIWIVEHCL